ncbi:MAG TPA: phosphoglucosamine mutase, partial [Phycisphaerae bacterium]|nr:phosphoglucosamine mutase [Phycisphaerae bacterium]
MDRLMVSVSGVRGTVGGTLTPRVACDFACAFGTMLGAGTTVTVARDSRTSGPMLRNAVTGGLLATGVNVVDLHLASTPAAALMTSRLSADGGVIITASHNPAEYNGIKFLRPTGTGLAAAAAQRLKEVWQAGEYTFAGWADQGAESSNADAAATYVQAVCDTCDVAAISARGF